MEVTFGGSGIILTYPLTSTKSFIREEAYFDTSIRVGAIISHATVFCFHRLESTKCVPVLAFHNVSAPREELVKEASFIHIVNAVRV